MFKWIVTNFFWFMPWIAYIPRKLKLAACVSVIAWSSQSHCSIRLQSRFLVTRTRLESRWNKWRFDSSRVTFFTEWLGSSHSQSLETRVRVIFTKSLSSWWTKPLRLHTKKWAFFASVMIKIGGNVLFCLSSRGMLHFKDQVSSTCIEGDLRRCFHWGVSRSQYTDTLSWFSVVFAHRDHGSGPHTDLESFPDTSKVS